LPNTKVVVCAVPFIDSTDPIMAPAVLKSCLTTAGIDSVAIDLNIKIVNAIVEHPNKKKILDFFFSQIIHKEVVDDLTEIIDYCADEIIKHKPSIVALSLLIYSCQIFTRWLCAAIKQKHSCQIVVGGTGTKNFIADHRINFCTQMKDLGLIDDYILGDGEISIVRYCQGNIDYSGINSTTWTPIPNLNNLPYPDYTDYDFSLYRLPVIPLCDTRGCVQECEFCDIIQHWKKFQYRTADDIFNEMQYQLNKYKINYFDFRSSLSNGNTREFKKLLSLICDYNKHKPKANQISWSGYFIVRSSKQHPEDLWPLLRDSNAMLFVGIESVISTVRNRMGKKFTNEDIDYHLEMAQKYNVPLGLLMIVAYPTETLKDYEYTKQWFRDRKCYAESPVAFLNLSFASILPGTTLEQNSESMNIQQGKLPSIWINQNLKISSSQRIEYMLELNKICTEECGFKSLTNEQTIEHTVDDDY
jgi:hypothetical protein